MIKIHNGSCFSRINYAALHHVAKLEIKINQNLYARAVFREASEDIKILEGCMHSTRRRMCKRGE